jgi:3-oxoadipate enol-lactonase
MRLDDDATARFEVKVSGTTVPAFGCGRTEDPAVVLAIPCGYPADLCAEWMRVLSADHYVVTWETRGMFGGDLALEAFDALGTAVDDQAEDLWAVLDAAGVERAHLMGLCGGAVIAARAAALRQGAVTSLSLWHGDYSGTVGTVTDHQRNFKALLEIAACGRDVAALIRESLMSTALDGLPADLAALLASPYETDERFYRYAVLVAATMSVDIEGTIAGIDVPALVVTSGDDRTAHPDGSGWAARTLPNARLRVRGGGDHLSAFEADAECRAFLADFFNEDSHRPRG